MSEIAEKAAEVTAEVVEETVDGVVDVMAVVRTNPATVIAGATLGLIVGAAGGYFIAKKQLKSFYEDVSSSEIAQAKQFYANLNKVDVDGAVLTPMDVLEQRHGAKVAAEALRTYRGVDAETPAQSESELTGDEQDEILLAKTERKVKVQETHNVFAEPKFDLEEERQHRTADKPYVITHDEYFEAEKEYDTISLTYYEMDDELVDERDQPISNTDGSVGDDNLVRFGHGSKDANIVYVRNDELKVDYEIQRSTGSYLEEVLGLPKEEPNSLKHSDRDARRAFRRGDG